MHLKNLNKQQLKAATTTEGAVMVVAGPGTGKTQVMGARIAEILQTHDINPENILCLTYTDAATISLSNRLVRFIGSAGHQVAVNTYHAFANKVIQENPDFFKTKELEPASDLEIIEIIHEVIDNLPKGHTLKRYNNPYFITSSLKRLFETIKSENYSVEQIEEQARIYLEGLLPTPGYSYQKDRGDKKAGDPTQKFLAEQQSIQRLVAASKLFQIYQQKMEEKGRYQFADMLKWVYDLFCREPDILARYQEQYQYVLVDEFQDTNGIQLSVLYKLIEYWENPNVFIVGDDDQSIYKFQGASVDNIINFYNRYKNHVETIVLKTNYRSFQEILDASSALINENKERIVEELNFIDKEITAFFKPEEDLLLPFVSIHEYQNEFQEAVGLSEAIIRLRDQGVPLNEIALIYHQHKNVAIIQQYFNYINLPYQTSRRVNVLTEPSVVFLISLIKYFEKERNFIHSGEYLIYDILHHPIFGLKSLEISEVIHQLKKDRLKLRGKLKEEAELLEYSKETIEKFSWFEEKVELLSKDFVNMGITLWLEKILNEFNIIEQTLKSDDGVFQMQCIYTFFEFIKSENTKKNVLNASDLIRTLEKMELENIPLPINRILKGEAGVNFTTAHSSKGLEYDYVFIMKCTQALWIKKGPNLSFNVNKIFSKISNNVDIEEKRRLFYVAMTRAKKGLVFSYPKTEAEKEMQKVIFLDEITRKIDIPTFLPTISDTQGLSFLEATLSSFAAPINQDLINNDFVNDRIENIVMDATKLNSYLRCAVAFFYERILNIPSSTSTFAAFGTSVHKTMDWFMKQKLITKKYPSITEVKEIFTDEMERYSHIFSKQEIKLKTEQGEEALENFLPNWLNKWDHLNHIKTEFQTKVTFENIPLRGDIDRIDITEKSSEIVEYKTGSVDKTHEKVKVGNKVFIENPEEADKSETVGGDHWRQVYLYKLLADLDHRIVRKPSIAFIYYLEEDNDKQELRVDFNYKEMELVKNQLRTVYAKIKNKEFTQGCNQSYCRWCNFQKQMND